MGKKEVNIPTSGMTDKHPMNVKDNEYPFMLNGNMLTDISSAVTLTNEHSNFLCNGFPEGYKVIGLMFVPADNITIVWLVDPVNNKSQIGYLTEFRLTDANDQFVANPCTDCIKKKEEATPLEQTEQEPICTYTCITSSDCWNFSMDHPIRKGVIKKDDCGDSIYFTDYFNPVRVLKLTSGTDPDCPHCIEDSQRAIVGYTGECVDEDGDPVVCDEINSDCECVSDDTIICKCCQPVYAERCTDEDVNCVKTRLWPQVSHICVEPVTGGVVPGGSLRAGVYQLAVAYSDSNGERATRTFSTSNPVSVFDPNQTVLGGDSPDLGYPTDLAVKFLIKDLDTSLYSFIEVFVAATINRTLSVKQYENVDITSIIQGTLEYTLSDFEKGKDVVIDDILQVFPIYEKAQEITSAGNTLLLANLTGPRDLNLQRAVNNISPFISWESAEANEWFYNDGANAAKYRGYLRDEVYAFGIVFERNNTLDTCAYPFIGRPQNTVYTDSFTKAGNWIPYNVNYAPIGTYALGRVVYYKGTSYVNLGAGGPPHNTTTPPDLDAVNWAPINLGTDLEVVDTEIISNEDVLIFPGCDDKKPAYNRRWEVYNTAFNRGQPCDYLAGGLACVQEKDKIICTSYSYAPTSIAMSSIAGEFQVGETVNINGGPCPACGIVTFVHTALGYILVETATAPTPDPVAGDVVSGVTSGASGVVTSYLKGDTVPNDCYVDPGDASGSCADNYPTLYTDIDIEPIIRIDLKVPMAGIFVNGESFTGSGGSIGVIVDASHQGGSEPYLLVRIDGTTPVPVVNDLLTGGTSGATATVKKVTGCTQNELPDPVPPCDPDHVRDNNYANPPAWSIIVNYVIGDLVTYGGQRYIALTNNVGVSPPSSVGVDWAVDTTPRLCVDAQLAISPSGISVPYAVLERTEEVELSQITTNNYYIYPLPSVTAPGMSHPQDPTKTLAGSPQEGCILPAYRARITGNTWLWREITFPSGDYPNSLGANAMGIVPPATGDCVGFVSPQALPNYPMYFLGTYLADPGDPCATYTCPCSDVPPDSDNDQYCACSNAAGETDPNKYPEPANIPPPVAGSVGCWGDYWNIGGPAPMVGEVNNTLYQSYWYSFTGTAVLPTVVIQAKIMDSYNTFAIGDWRIDVYADSPSGAPLYSTGQDTVNPAQLYYTGGEADRGVLIAGDVAGSVPAVNLGGPLAGTQLLPLTVGRVYYIHVYLLATGAAKLNVAPDLNPVHDDADVDNGTWQCPCYLPNYAFGNLCVNYPKTNNTKTVTLPAINTTRCTYNLYYRQQEVIDSGCLFQTYEYGDFAFTQSNTKKYPPNPEVWGDLCGENIRHFKMPDVLVSKVQDENQIVTVPNNGRTAKIYPLGIMLDTEIIKAWLTWAATPVDLGGPGLMTEEEKLGITGYKIVRANRVGNKSILGKGLLYDMWKYKEYEWVNGTFSNIPSYYPSYPFNDLRNDPFLTKNGSEFIHPFNGTANDRFAFLSPETTFNGPTIGAELKMEAVNFGDSLGKFYTVRDHPKYVLLSRGGIALATTMAALQLAADVLILIGQLLGNWTVGLAFTVPVGSIVGLVGAVINLAPNFFKYAKEWNDIITNFGVPKNFAMYYAAVGNYHSSGVSGEVHNAGNKRRLIDNSSYLLAGNLSLNDSGKLIRINNYLREDSVYLKLNERIEYADTVPPYNTELLVRPDTSRFLMSSDFDGQPCSRGDRQSQVASYYAAIKYNVPDQYGSIHDLEWLYTGECKPITWEKQQNSTCEPIYGGDTFISRMTQKRKLPFFVANPVGITTNVDFQYHRISNITDAKYFFNSVGESTLNSGGVQFAEVEHKFDCEDTGGLYLNGSIYLFSYGIASFICESDFNLNFRYARDTKSGDFYPHQSDIENWTQEFRIPIADPNHYLYNRDYSKQNKENFFCTQPAIYTNAECVTTYRNRVINSLPDADSDFFTDPWRVFLGEDKADFDLSNGALTGLNGLEREKVLVLFENTYLIFNAFYTMETGQGTAQIGTGPMFAQKPEEYVKTDVGYSGTSHHAFTSTQFGHFWVDAQRSAVFMLPPGSQVQEISASYNVFFNNNLPFFILRDFPTYPVDNNYKDVGLAIVWDNKFDRLFLTKLDYQLLPEWRALAARSLDDVTPTTPAIHYFEDVPFQGRGIFLVTTDGVVTEYTKIELTDLTYFCNKSWTLAYSPAAKSWISYYSFVPNYYIGHENYFQTGVNYVRPGADTIGIWNHLISNKSYQVFYGHLYPFITDVVVKEQLINRQLQSLEYQSDFIRFQNDYDYYYNPGVTFNKMVVWTENQNSGNLELVPQAQNDLSQALSYPAINANSTTILVTRKENSWRVNQIVDLVADKFSNIPPMILGCEPYLKSVNADAINYRKPTFQRQHMTSDYFTLRFINDIYSNYKIINKWFINDTIKSYT